MKLFKTSFLLVLLLNSLPLFSQDNEFPKVMYVNSIEGLRIRLEPSLNSTRIGSYLHGERIVVYERSNMRVTIDGITDYWYKTEYFKDFEGSYIRYSWVFGGYLSNNLPPDAPVVLGRWDDENDSRQYYFFGPDHSYREGYKETDMGIWGTWKLNGNILTLILDSAMNDIIIDPPDIVNVQITIISRNNIILTFQNNERVRLTRNNDIW
ncbi:MAG: SH3 domain-containing protein [Spirochaetaceae bacterium]|jgi:hypothetical protein|nr:SH3 domain-containing protein [Spirochaetaceae bacterium]